MPSYVIVGASRGLGYEWLRQLGRDPKNTVIGLARTPSAVQKKLSADKIGNNVHVLAGDLVDNKSLVEAAAKASKLTENGAVDYLIVNGVYQNAEADFLFPTEFVGKEKLLHDYMVEAMEVNVIGVMYAVNAFLPLVRKSSIKKITVMSTGLADAEVEQKSTVAYMVTYSATKAALNMVVIRYGIQLKDEGIIFLALSPGLVATQEAPPAPEHMERIGVMMQEFATTYPHFQGPITPAESVAMQKKVIEGLEIKDSGSFLSHHGTKQWI